MSGPWHPTGRATVNARSPRALGVCQRCGFTWNLNQLQSQRQWGGVELIDLRTYVCPPCLDVPQIQLRTIIIPPDPLPVMNARPEQYTVEEPSYIATEPVAFFGNDLTTEDGNNLLWEIEDVPNPNPNHPADYPQ